MIDTPIYSSPRIILFISLVFSVFIFSGCNTKEEHISIIVNKPLRNEVSTSSISVPKKDTKKYIQNHQDIPMEALPHSAVTDPSKFIAHPRTRNTVIKDQILVLHSRDITFEDAVQIIKKYNGRPIGYIPDLRSIQVEFDNIEDYSFIEDILRDINLENGIVVAKSHNVSTPF